jgi:hypothetical protein
MSALEIIQFAGWSVARGGFDDGVPRIQDLELARKLAFTTPTNIRGLIAQLIRSGNLNDVAIVCGSPRNPGRAGRPTKNEYWLTEEQALFVVARSETAKATELLKAIIAVFLAVKREVLEQRTTEQLLAAIFPNLPARAKPLFSDLIAALLRLRREHDSATNPPWARWLAMFVYALAFPVEGQQQKRRALNETPSGSRVDHSMLSEPAREHLRQIVFAGTALAKSCVSWEDWKTRMELAFGSKPIQLPFLVPMLEPPKRDEEDPEAAE